MSGGNCSHRSVYSCFVLESLLVRWFFNWSPAAMRATSLYWGCTMISERAFRKPGRFEAAACSKYVLAMDNSFLSAGGRGKEAVKTCSGMH